MNKCSWEVIEGFSSPKEYERFIAWITERVKAGMVEQTPVLETMRDQVLKRSGLGA